ncbi:DUF2244 domain-containing protein [Massilia sp. Dwa41.01b]|uniref:DUF2244 domain-containing protein n=1 Tax=unclassified Massilia TaxID=2609279 RepID=UPI001603A325|nr:MULTISPECIES: DUF2244 domain-containing protein [unclassified Massilia]QNA88984.1 DUF2244 domain-containing protein [Massilia sp. Dwa41.01b]QNA99875.1 DUF2244 domain-containing protein [Massilia sp. Se16.2.3]
MPRTWTLKRNCSLTPRQSLLVYALLCCGSFGIALVFLLQGIWIVLAFALLEMTAVGWALLHYARHALDVEHIALTERWLLVERIDCGRREQIRLDPVRTRVLPPRPRERKLIRLEAPDRTVDIGSYVSEPIRLQVAQELLRAIRHHPAKLLP